MMEKVKAKSIRPFIGARHYEVSRSFYRDLGFEELVLDPTMCFFKVNADLGFYLQKAYVKDWVDNSMIFLEVEDIENCEKELLEKALVDKYAGVRISKIENLNWGREIFMHDPSGILWHFAQFKAE